MKGWNSLDGVERRAWILHRLWDIEKEKYAHEKAKSEIELEQEYQANLPKVR